MKGATLFSGIGAPEQAMPWVDWRWCAEIEPFPCAVLRARHPKTTNLGDVTDAGFIERARAFGPIDLLVFGSPCQSYSVAGKRAGMDDPRGVLALVALGIVNALRPTWFIFENVPGLLSSYSGEADLTVESGDRGGSTGNHIEESDFATFLCGVEECGYSGAWASPDAQWFGVPQRRERVFFVGHSGDWRGPAAVLSEFHRLSGHPAPSREAGKGFTHEIAPGLTNSGRGVERGGDSRGQDPVVAVAFGGNNTGGAIEVATACRAHGSPHGDFESETFIVACPLTKNPYADNESRESLLVAHSLRGEGFDASEDGTGRGTPVGFGWNKSASQTMQVGDTVDALQASPMSNPAVAIPRAGMAVRRLTPRECERLQGFPDNFTAIAYRNKPAAYGPRYRALGNSMAVPVLAYLGSRIRMMEAEGK